MNRTDKCPSCGVGDIINKIHIDPHKKNNITLLYDDNFCNLMSQENKGRGKEFF